MRAHYLQHVPFEDLGYIETWLQQSGYDITSTIFYKSIELPRIEDVDFLIIMGGSMSVNDEEKYPWLIGEKKFIKNFIASGKPVLGICLGAQLIASALGGSVFPNVYKEIGWFSVKSVKLTNVTIFSFPPDIEAFHWHGETFSLPNEAIRIAESSVCNNQAFQIGKNVIGIQFHLESTEKTIEKIVANCREELVDGIYIQSEEKIKSASREQYNTINNQMAKVLEYLHRSIFKV